MPDDQQRAEQEIFAAAVELPASERAAFVFHACDGNAQLELRIHRLIAAHEFAQQAASQIEPPAFALEDPDRIGAYRVLERIGEGGMGIVYLAEQEEPVRRRVALKIIKLGMDTREVIARFESERQALAMMNHQSIARILDVGATEAGRPYFVMEYVRGIAITAYCDKMRLGIDARLELFRDVCDAIQHAHQKGIIHRDIKPSNILVSEEGNRPLPKVIDFGVAKAADYRLSRLTLHTRIGHFIGTPEYMSPEQAEMSPLNVDTRSDVYSLGAVLYELMSGVRPLEFGADKPGYTEIQHAIRSLDPPLLDHRIAMLEAGDAQTVAENRSISASALQRKLRGELSWIAARALAKDPNRRYSTAQSLAHDVERYLNDEPVRAGPEGIVYRGHKFVRRHSAALAAAAVVVLALVGGLATATFGLMEARRERDTARQAQSEAETVTEFLAHMLTAADPDELGREVTIVELLDNATEAVAEEFADAPLVEARLRGSIGQTYRSLGRLEDAEANLQRRLELHQQHLTTDDPRTLESLQALGSVYYRQGRYAEAERMLRTALDESRRQFGSEHGQTLDAMTSLAIVYDLDNRYPDAHELYREVYETRRRVLGDEHPDTLGAMNNYGRTLRYFGRLAEAVLLYEQTLEAKTRVLGEEHVSTLITAHNLANVYMRLKRFADSERMLQSLIDSYDRILGQNHPRSLRPRASLGILYQSTGRLDEAVNLLQSTLESRRRVLGDTHPETLDNAASLADVFLEMDRAADAEPLLRHAFENVPADWQRRPAAAALQMNLGRCALAMGQLDEAEQLLQQAYDRLTEIVGSGGEFFSPQRDQALESLIEVYERTGRPFEASRLRDLQERSDELLRRR